MRELGRRGALLLALADGPRRRGADTTKSPAPFLSVNRKRAGTPAEKEAEVDAIDAEHAKNLQSDFWRSDAVLRLRARPDHPYSRFFTGNRQTLRGGDTGAPFTDFDAIGFTVTTTEGKTVSVYADRCGDAGGGGYSEAIVEDEAGEEVARTKTPDAALLSVVETKQKAHPDWMPYFHLQHDDYITLKELASAHVLAGADGAPEGMATIDVAVDALKEKVQALKGESKATKE